MERTINIIGNINEQSLSLVLEQISKAKELIKENLQSVIEYNEEVKPKNYIAPEPVVVNISSPGGFVIYGNAIIDELRELKVPVITRCLGMAASMGYLIYLSGDYRIMGNSSTLMYHGSANSVTGTIPNLEDSLEFDKELEIIGDNLILEQTNIDKEKLDFYKDRSRNWYMFKKESLENGSTTHDLSLEDMIELVKKEWIDKYIEEEDKN